MKVWSNPAPVKPENGAAHSGSRGTTGNGRRNITNSPSPHLPGRIYQNQNGRSVVTSALSSYLSIKSVISTTVRSTITTGLQTSGALLGMAADFAVRQVVLSPDVAAVVPGGKTTVVFLGVLWSQFRYTEAQPCSSFPKDSSTIVSLKEKYKENGEHLCDNGKVIKGLYRCNGFNNCGDNSDENNCTQKEYDNNFVFFCENGEVIPQNVRCDRKNDCTDKSDEKCAQGDFLKDNKGLWLCIDNQNAINLSMRCDEDQDCQNNSDEQCGLDEYQDNNRGLFLCADQSGAINRLYKCDRDFDCRDGSDERDCIDPGAYDVVGRFRCDSNTPLPPSLRCNGNNDCRDGTDEDCKSQEDYNSVGKFLCASGTIRPLSWQCDGDNDCCDNSDELNCTISTTDTETTSPATDTEASSFGWVYAPVIIAVALVGAGLYCVYRNCRKLQQVNPQPLSCKLICDALTITTCNPRYYCKQAQQPVSMNPSVDDIEPTSEEQVASDEQIEMVPQAITSASQQTLNNLNSQMAGHASVSTPRSDTIVPMAPAPVAIARLHGTEVALRDDSALRAFVETVLAHAGRNDGDGCLLAADLDSSEHLEISLR
nr:hypothetical protein [Endozoicomonas sp.]